MCEALRRKLGETVCRGRTWVGETVTVLTRFTYPGDRYFVVDRHRISSQSRLGGGDLK